MGGDITSVDLIVLSRWNIERVDKIHAGGGLLGEGCISSAIESSIVRGVLMAWTN
jgi:hypothetical protein